MSYLVNNSRVSTLLINGSNYTSNFVSWSVSDQSAFKQGVVSTTGQLILGTSPGGALIEDYDRNNFKRGMVITLDLQEPGGTSYRHPRGFLYVFGVSYNVENEQLEVEIGCRLALMALTDDFAELAALVPVQLAAARNSFSNCSGAFASTAQYIYQNNQGQLASDLFFAGDTRSTIVAGEWISVLGVTALSASPLAGSSPVPDQVNLSYQVLDQSGGNNGGRGYIERNETQSYYYLQYPAVIYKRQNSSATGDNPNGNLESIKVSATVPPGSGFSSACGNTPPRPPVQVDVEGKPKPPSCNEGYQSEATPYWIPAFRRELTETHYSGPAAQVQRVYSEVRGPAIEANQQYWADKYAYCKATWAEACNPNGSCPQEGTNQILLSYQETTNFYGNANEVVKVIVDNYATTLSGAQSSDWRAGNVNGSPQDFKVLNPTSMYRLSRSVTEYAQKNYGNRANTQIETVYNSSTTRQSGINGGRIDALDGIVTKTVRISTTTAPLEIAPDRLSNATADTKERIVNIVLFTGRYTSAPPQAGPYVIEEAIPTPLINPWKPIEEVVEDYSVYLSRFIKGDAFGLQIGEGLRSDVVNNWRPGMPFRYYDPKKGKVLAMRMDATVWGVDEEGASFVTDGLWLGESNGTVTVPQNLVGNSSPDMGSGGAAPSPTVPPSIVNETGVSGGAIAWNVDVFFSLSSTLTAFGNDGVVPVIPSDLSVNIYGTSICFVEGGIIAPGGLLATTTGGSIPVDLAGQLITATATVVNGDLFG